MSKKRPPAKITRLELLRLEREIRRTVPSSAWAEEVLYRGGTYPPKPSLNPPRPCASRTCRGRLYPHQYRTRAERGTRLNRLLRIVLDMEREGKTPEQIAEHLHRPADEVRRLLRAGHDPGLCYDCRLALLEALSRRSQRNDGPTPWKRRPTRLTSFRLWTALLCQGCDERVALLVSTLVEVWLTARDELDVEGAGEATEVLCRFQPARRHQWVEAGLHRVGRIKNLCQCCGTRRRETNCRYCRQCHPMMRAALEREGWDQTRIESWCALDDSVLEQQT